MPKTIMVVDNEKRLLSLMERYLAMDDYRVLVTSSCAEALALMRQAPPDLLLLDVLLPTTDNCRALIDAYEQEHALPIILLTAHAEEAAALDDPSLGQYEYLVKPFRPRELSARIRLALRRAGHDEQAPRPLEVAGITLDKDNRSVKVADRYVDLTPSEFELLAIFMATPGRVISRMDLLDVLQGVRCEGNQRLIDIHIKNLRSKIELDPHAPRYIETVYGFGYRFRRA